MSKIKTPYNRVYNTVVKKKKLQKLGSARRYVLLPKSWIECMEWNKDTIITMVINPETKQITITEDEKASSIVTVE